MEKNSPSMAVAKPESTDTWMNPDIIPFTREHERMLKDLHAIVTGAAKQFEAIAPMIQNSPLLNMFGLDK